MPRLLALPPLGEDEDGTSVVLCGCLIRTKEVQAAGQAFFDAFERHSLLPPSPSASPSPSDSGEDDNQASGSPSQEKKKGKLKKDREAALKLHELLRGVDLYALLECDEGCSQEDLKKSYRALCLVHHPDKQSQDKTTKEMEDINKHFLKIQEAYDVLSDAKKRRKYDSMVDFDDHVPSGLKKNQDFFTVFGPVFKRNAKWSERKPVPDLGDENTPFAKVEQIYDFWRNFESWRDMDEQIKEEEGEDCFMDLDEAECREERRWMERENEKLRSKYRRIERQRILKLVANAEQCDPRVKVEKDRKWAIYEAARAEKEAMRLEVERVAKEEEEQRAVAERELEEKRKLEKEQKDKERDAKKKVRASLRKRVSGMQLGIMEEQLQDFLLALEQSEMQSLIESLTSDPQADAVFKAMREKSFEPIIVQKTEDESTEKGASSQEEEMEETPEARAERERLAEDKHREQERRAKAARVREEQEKKQREEEAAKRVEEKASRDAKKKIEQDKREAERKRVEKKDVERQKKAEEKQQKEAQRATEKAEQDKEVNRQRAEEQRAKQKLENDADALRKIQEAKQIVLERDRLKRVEILEKMEWVSVVECTKEESEKPDVASLLVAASKREGEDRLDAQLASLGSFFILGVRPDKDSPALSSALRNRVKKLRTRLRASAAAGEFTASVPDVPADEVSLEKVLSAVVNGIVEEPVQEAPLEEQPAGKKKTKAKAKPEEENLDVLLKEFDMSPDKSSKAKKNKKK